MALVCTVSEGLSNPTSTAWHYVITGTFNTIFLYLLAFNPTTYEFRIHGKYLAEGPHQYLAYDSHRRVVYATTWAWPDPSLSAWQITGTESPALEWINTVPILATSSYIAQDPKRQVLYSAGGPTGEVHAVNPATGGFGEKLQQLYYVDEMQLPKEDRTRKALRYGSHGIDLSADGSLAFVPHVGKNAIVFYRVQADATLSLIREVPSPEAGDGPRHNIPSPDGRFLYVVTEHTSFVDVYEITLQDLHHIQRVSVIPPGKDRASYRGDTLRFSSSGRYLYATTRGKTEATLGYVVVWALDSTTGRLSEPLAFLQTDTSGGKANAIDVFPSRSVLPEGVIDWILLTDDEKGYVSVLQFDQTHTLTVISRLQLGVDDPEALKIQSNTHIENTDTNEAVGASHALWIS